MSPRSWSDASLTEEASARRLALRDEQAAHTETRIALREANRLLLRTALSGQLAHPQDLELYFPLEKLTDPVGRIVWSTVQVVVEELLTTRPNLAAPAAAPPSCPRCALRSQPTGSSEASTSDPVEAAQGATRCEPGAGADGRTHPTESR